MPATQGGGFWSPRSNCSQWGFSPGHPKAGPRPYPFPPPGSLPCAGRGVCQPRPKSGREAKSFLNAVPKATRTPLASSDGQIQPLGCALSFSPCSALWPVREQKSDRGTPCTGFLQPWIQAWCPRPLLPGVLTLSAPVGSTQPHGLSSLSAVAGPGLLHSQPPLRGPSDLCVVLLHSTESPPSPGSPPLRAAP